MIKKIILGIVGIIVLIVVIGVIAGGGKKETTSTTEQKTQTQESVAASPSPMKITARELADSFDENQVAAEAKWKDKLIEFSAPISNITDTGVSFSNIGAKEFSFTQVSCRVENKDQLLKIKNGQTVTVRGVVGTQTAGVIDVKQCTIVL